MIATRTNAFSITPDVYDDAVSYLADFLGAEAAVKPGPRRACFAPVTVTFVAGPLAGVAYSIAHVALASPIAAPATASPPTSSPKTTSAGSAERRSKSPAPGLARDRALEHVRAFVATLDTFAAEPAAAGA